MSIGSVVRKVIGPTLWPFVGAAYRRIFVCLSTVAEELAPHLPATGRVIDVGGGDGELLNRLLRLRPGLHAVVIDKGEVGASIAPDVADRVTLLPHTALADYHGADVDAVLVSDVLHHVDRSEWVKFLKEAHALLKPGGTLIVKDFAPGGLRSLLGLWSDRYVSGDGAVRFFPPGELVGLARMELPVRDVIETQLLRRDKPNYAYVFRF